MTRRPSKTSVRGAIAATIAIAIVVAMFLFGGDPAMPPVTPSAPGDARATADVATAEVDGNFEPANRIERDSTEDVPPSWLEQPHRFELELVGMRHGPVGTTVGSTTFVGLEGASVGVAQISIDDRGHARLAFSGKKSQLTIVLDTGLMRRLRLNSGQSTTTVHGEAQSRHTVGPRPPPTIEVPAARVRLDDPIAVFGHGQESEDPAYWSQRWHELVLATGRREPSPPTGAITGIAVDETRKACIGAVVHLTGSCNAQATTDSAGRFEFDQLAGGRFSLTTTHTIAGRARKIVDVADRTVEVIVALDRARCLRGCVVTPDGKPISNRRLIWIGDSGDWRNDVESNHEGAFLFADLPTAVGWLWVCNDDDGAVTPAVGIRTAPPYGSDLTLTMDVDKQHGSLEIDPVLPPEIPADHIAVRLWHVASGLGVHLSRRPDRTVFEKIGLAAGAYEVEVVAPGIGVVNAGRHWVDGKHKTNLGRFEPPAPGRLVINAAADALPDGGHDQFEILHLRTDANLFVNTTPEPPAATLLAAGDYALVWRDRDLHRHYERFTVRSGATITLSLRR